MTSSKPCVHRPEVVAVAEVGMKIDIPAMKVAGEEAVVIMTTPMIMMGTTEEEKGEEEVEIAEAVVVMTIRTDRAEVIAAAVRLQEIITTLILEVVLIDRLVKWDMKIHTVETLINSTGNLCHHNILMILITVQMTDTILTITHHQHYQHQIHMKTRVTRDTSAVVMSSMVEAVKTRTNNTLPVITTMRKDTRNPE